MRSFEGLTSLSKGKRLVEILFISFTKKKKNASQIGTKVQIRNFGQGKSCNSSQKNTCSPVETRRRFNIDKTSMRHRRRRIDVL